jgi:hypothetical protein|tara:strand:+ start:418 stop:597 length:180 start_codon:yes stop_codon:yes gene_type:complete
MKYNKNKSAINFIIQKTEDNIKKYKAMLRLKTSNCILSEALKDTLVMNMYLDETIKEEK